MMVPTDAPRVQCAVCNKLVDTIETRRDFNRQQTIFTVRCHGDKEQIAIDDQDLVDWGGNVKIEAGFAFTTKLLEKEN